MRILCQIGLIVLVYLTSGVSFASASSDAKNFGQLPKIHDAAISPDGNRLAAFVNVGGEYKLGVFAIQSGSNQPIVAPLSKGVKPQWIRWANDDVVLASIWQSQKVQGTPISTGHIYTLDVNQKKGSILIEPNNRRTTGSRLEKTSFFRQFNNHVIDMLPNDPDHILMSFSDENVVAPDVQKVNVRTGNYSMLRRGRETIQSWYTDLRGEIRIGQGLKDSSRENWTLLIRDANSEDWNSYDKYPGLEPDESIFGFTSDPNELIVGRYNGKDTRGLYIYDLGQKKITRKLFHNDDYDVSGIVKSSDGSEIVGARYVSDNDETELFGTRESALENIRQNYPGYAVDYIDSNKDYSKVVLKISSPSDPGGIFVATPANGQVSLITANYPGLTPDQLGSVQSVRYKARDGKKIPAFVTLPRKVDESGGLDKVPFIVLPHGGPYARDSKRFDYLAQYFATRGFAVLQMNFRGSIGYGKEFEEAGRDNWVLMQEDVEDGTRWLFEKGYADPSRTCIAGWSYGGYAALIGKIKNPELYACTISIAGVTDLQDLINDMKKYRFGKLTARGFLKGFDSKDDVKENSPVKRADEMSGPILMVHGTLDNSVHFDQFRRMKSALKKSDAKVTAIEFKDEDHYLSNQENRVELFDALDEFLESSVGVSEFAN